MTFDIRKDGFEFWKPGDGLMAFQTLYKDEEGQSFFEMIYHPTADQIAETLRKYDIDPGEILEIVRVKMRDSHTLFVDINIYKDAKKE